VRANSLRDAGYTLLPCNWLQAQENSLDPVHVEWLHTYLTNYTRERQGLPPREVAGAAGGKHKKIGFDVFEHGIIKRRVVNDGTEDDAEWSRGHPVLFPNVLVVGSEDSPNFQFRVPVDDEHTLHIAYTVSTPGVPVPEQKGPVVYEIPLPDHDAMGAPVWKTLEQTLVQDMMAWWTQGPIARRELERLGVSDEGIILFRKLLEQQIDKVALGEDPMNTFRDPVQNVSLPVQTERARGVFFGGTGGIFNPLADELRELFAKARETAGAGDD
jgi:5,5'-dehydrodivanillate O-demethylase